MLKNPSPLRKYVLPFVFVGLATGLTWLFWPHNQSASYAFYYLAALLAAIYGGRWAGLLAMFTGALLGDYLFIPPYYSWQFLVSQQGLTHLAIFIAVTGIMVGLVDVLRRSQEGLREKEIRLGLAMGAARMGSWIYDIHAGRFDADTLSKELHGLGADEAVPSLEVGLRHASPDDRMEFQRRFAQALENQDTFNHEYQVLLPDGSERWVAALGRVNLACDYFFGMVQDITESKQVTEALRSSEERLQFFIHYMPAAIAMFDREMRYLALSQRWVTDFGLADGDILGRSHYGIFPEITEGRKEAHRRGLAGEVISAKEDRIVLANGTILWCQWEVRPWYALDNTVGGIVIFSEDITERKHSEDKIRQLAFYDPLTALPNRTLFATQLLHALQHAKRASEQVAVLFLDLDNFKRINDTLGHSFGDQLLQSVAQHLSDCLRDEDLVSHGTGETASNVARFGGDEFMAMLVGITEPSVTARIAQRIIEAFEKPVDLQGHKVSTSVSIGIALYPDDGDTAETLIKHADTAMYHAKNLGRGRYQFYNQSIDDTVLAQIALEGQLRVALELGQLVLHYQPMWDCITGRVVGGEALVRWQHPEKGLLMPKDFIGLAEKTGLIGTLGAWVLASACRQNCAWQAAGLAAIPIAVNVSIVQLRQPTFVESVRQLLLDTGLAAQHLMLEVTESVLIEDADSALAVLQQLHELGVGLAIDDFGTGYSSLMYLKRLPVDTLKIDQCFVKNVDSDPDNAAIVTAVIALGRGLKLNLVAEGVETSQEREFLQACGCADMQGFLMSRPLSAPQFAELLSRQHP